MPLTKYVSDVPGNISRMSLFGIISLRVEISVFNALLSTRIDTLSIPVVKACCLTGIAITFPELGISSLGVNAYLKSVKAGMSGINPSIPPKSRIAVPRISKVSR